MYHSSKQKSQSPVARAALEALEGRRLFSAGDLDPTFGTGGVGEPAFANPAANFVTSVDTKSGKTVVGGAVTQNGSPVLALARYTSAGKLDKTFSGDGLLTLPAYTSADDVLIQADGKVLVTASGGGGEVLLRLNANGTPDKTFGGGDGAVNTLVGSSLALAPDNKIVVGGAEKDNTFSAARFTKAGVLDTTFGGDGVAGVGVTPASSSSLPLAARDVAVQPDGKVVLVGPIGSNVPNSP